jgi:uncharacterized protein (TIGR02284 family)
MKRESDTNQFKRSLDLMINEYESGSSRMDDASVTTGTDVDNDNVISTLNGLIETCRDGQEGFQQAADGVERSDLKSLFFEFSQQRAQFTGELQDLVRGLGGDPENAGSLAGSLHRGWINIKAAVTGKDDGAILNECERGEDTAKSTYKSALEESMPEYIKETIRTQFAAIQEAHDRVKALRDAASDSANSASSSR